MPVLLSRILPSYFFLILLGASHGSTPGTSIGVPVRHFEPSWAASCAHGTAVALKCQDSVLVFIRTPSSNIWRHPLRSLQSPEEISDLQVTPIQKMSAQFAPPWLSIGPNSFCAMTGLAYDVEHLCRVLQKQVDAEWNIYDKHSTTHGITMRLADTFQQETFLGSRPFGVQCLLVGGDDYDQERTFCVYTIDPSGAWQSWGGTSAIGKYAQSVREELAKKRTTPPTTLKNALKQIVDCWIETCKKQNVNLNAEDEYQVFVIRKENSVSKIYVVDDEVVHTIVQETAAAQGK